jgi:NAD(P)-dependent dehydrogenase (short-subunit alcohol dehydrogenase family)
MDDDLDLAGRRALVTAGSKGIGRAVTMRLREAGATALAAAGGCAEAAKPGKSPCRPGEVPSPRQKAQALLASWLEPSLIPPGAL